MIKVKKSKSKITVKVQLKKVVRKTYKKVALYLVPDFGRT